MRDILLMRSGGVSRSPRLAFWGYDVGNRKPNASFSNRGKTCKWQWNTSWTAAFPLAVHTLKPAASTTRTMRGTNHLATLHQMTRDIRGAGNQVFDMLPRHDQRVTRMDRKQSEKAHRLVILINDRRRRGTIDNRTEDAFNHGQTPWSR